MIRTAAAMRSERRYYPSSDRGVMETVCPRESVTTTIAAENQVPLYRYVHMNDEQNTQIFTFLLLPHLLCGLLDEVESSPFVYAEHLWTVRFQRGDTHFGVFLELKSVSTVPDEDRLGRHTKHHSSEQIQSSTVSVDFQFILKNREHFSRNESFGRKASVFYRGQPRHGRKKFLELATLSSKRYIYDDGRCIIELEMKNPDVFYNLWFDLCPDPTVSTHFDRSMPRSNSVINLMRLDGSLVSVGRFMHFESERFLYAESQWYLTLDLETNQSNSGDCNGQPQRIALPTHESDIVVRAELSLVRELTKVPENSYRTSTSSKRLHSVSSRVKCIATLPGGCLTKVMEFSIGSQGWPTQAYRVLFRNRSKEETDHKSTQVSQSHHVTSTCTDKSIGLKSAPDCQFAGSGSPIALLLACASSPISVKLQMTSFTNLAFVEVPLGQATAGAVPSYLTDPFKLPWRVQTSDSGKLLRIKFQSVAVMNRWENGGPTRCTTNSVTLPYPLIMPNAVYMIGCRIRIHPLSPQLHAHVLPVGPELVNLMRFTSGSRSSGLPTENDWDLPGNANPVANMIESGFSPTGVKMNEYDSNVFTSPVIPRRNQWAAVESEDLCEVAMNVTVAEASDKNTGLLNPMNGTILIEIEWVYHHLIFIDRLHSADLISARQYHQMRHELNRLRRERDELERQLMIKEMGLVQIDSTSCQGPMSMLPIESVSTFKTSEEEDRSIVQQRTSVYKASTVPSGERPVSLETRAPKTQSYIVPSEYREPRRISRSAYRDSYGSRLDSIGRSEFGRQDDSGGLGRGQSRYSFDNNANLEDQIAMDNCSVGRSSVNSDFAISRSG
ncbi:unnamed protein product [Echinostoma caproni]|uniref:CUB domain-containing protein n=1 Tax=Echinostoma caproni TaxID=27848 RepID=A0A183A7T5_9TREM|nr:unnamed protein product [Echinostoma caproni]